MSIYVDVMTNPCYNPDDYDQLVKETVFIVHRLSKDACIAANDN